MARRPRRNHSAQFKAKVALEAIASDKTLAELAQKYDVHANQIVDWRGCTKLLVEKVTLPPLNILLNRFNYATLFVICRGCQIFCVNGVRLLLRHSFLKLNTKLI
jgi:hypothetical protein